MEKFIYFKHKESNLELPLDYLKHNKEKDLSILIDGRTMEQKRYRVCDILFSDDWEVKVRYLSPEEIHDLLSSYAYSPMMNRNLRDKLFEIVQIEK